MSKKQKKSNRLVKQKSKSLTDLANYQIRTELNKAKWAAIWAPTHSKVTEPRRIERKVPNQDIIQAVVVEYLPRTGTLTTTELRSYLGLILLWEENNREAEQMTPLSLKSLAKLLGMPWHGSKTTEKLRKSLRRLARVPLNWENSFHDATTGQTLILYEAQHILTKLVFGEMREKGKRVRDQDRGAFKFDQRIIDNLLLNYSKPVYLADALALRGEIAILLFMHLDIVMADKPHYERNTAELFRDLGLHEHKMYRTPSGRKQRLQPALKELRGKRLSTGVIKKIEIVENAGGSDYKLVVTKGKIEVIDTKATLVQETTDIAENQVTDEQQALIAQLHNEFSVVIATATRLTTEHFETTKLQLAAWSYRDHSQIQDKAGWIIRAIENDYEPPQAYLDAIKEQEQREKLNRAKAKIAACSLCDDSGFRMIIDEGQRCAKRCSHDPAVEGKFQNA